MGRDANAKIFYGYKFDLNEYQPNAGYEDWYNDLIGPDYYWDKEEVKKEVCITGTFSDCNTMLFLGVLETIQDFNWDDNPNELNLEKIDCSNSDYIVQIWKGLLRKAYNSLDWEDKPPFDENLCKWLVVCDYF